jgi:transposase
LRTLVEEQSNRIVEQATLIDTQATLISEQTTLIEKMRAEMTVLLARLSSNSRTSSKPPSSDGYAKPDPK